MSYRLVIDKATLVSPDRVRPLTDSGYPSVTALPVTEQRRQHPAICIRGQEQIIRRIPACQCSSGLRWTCLDKAAEIHNAPALGWMGEKKGLVLSEDLPVWWVFGNILIEIIINLRCDSEDIHSSRWKIKLTSPILTNTICTFTFWLHDPWCIHTCCFSQYSHMDMSSHWLY